MKRALVLALAVAVPTSIAAAAPANVWKQLRRPLHIPHIAPGAPCPVAANPRSGPAYPLLSPEALLEFRYPAARGSEAYGSPWTAVPIAWHVSRSPLLIRGRQLDGSHILRFEGGQIPGTARWIGRSRSGSVRLLLRLRSPGCYAFQVDGIGFSRTIVFRAELRSAGDSPQVIASLRARGLPMESAGEFHSIAFDLLHVMGQRFANPGGTVVLWQFATVRKAQAVLIDRGGASLTILTPTGRIGASIFCGIAPCSPYIPHDGLHWYRSGRVLALYVGDDLGTLRAIESLLGEQFAGT